MAKLEQDFTHEDPWRIFKIMGEFVEGFDTFKDITQAVSIFGSARTKKSDKYYKLAEETAAQFVKAGYAVITGAGPGIMEAGNKGANEAGGESIGLNIIIPEKQNANPYPTKLVDFKYFFARKVMFAKYSEAGIYFPGGFGTLDEFFEIITLIQTQRMEKFPLILMGTEYWNGLIEWLTNTTLAGGCVSEDDMALFTVTDSPEEAVKIVTEFYK